MAFVARKPFVFNGAKYAPGDVVKGFPEDFFRAEGFIRTGFIVEAPDAPKPKRKPKAVIEEFVAVAEEATVVTEVSAEQ